MKNDLGFAPDVGICNSGSVPYVGVEVKLGAQRGEGPAGGGHGVTGRVLDVKREVDPCLRPDEVENAPLPQVSLPRIVHLE